MLGDGQTIRIEGFGELGVLRSRGIPLPVYIFIACVIIFWLVLRYTVYGRSLFAIGASPSAARLAGIRTKRVIFIAFLLSALCVALAGLIRLSQVGRRLGELAARDRAVGRDRGRPRRRQPVRRSRRHLRDGPRRADRRRARATASSSSTSPSFWIEVAGGLLLLGAVTVDRVRVRLTRADT